MFGSRKNYMNSNDNNFKSLLCIKSLPGIGNIKTLIVNKYLNNNFDNSKEFYDLYQHAKSKEIKLPNISPADFEMAYNKVELEIEKCKQHKIDMISYNDREYPIEFKSIDNPPVILFSKGDLSLLQSKQKKVAIIGSRDSSDYAKKISYNVSEDLAVNGIIIVSGLALGCDEYAHKGSLEKGKTISILPSGLKSIYPAANQGLASQILENGGCLVTEYPFESRPNKAFFIERDRLQSGISESIILIESKINGGSMKTIDFARKQGKEIFCWKHHNDYNDPEKTSGNLKLLNDSDIKSLSSKEDLIVFY